jgi:hypothetical protein
MQERALCRGHQIRQSNTAQCSDSYFAVILTECCPGDIIFAAFTTGTESLYRPYGHRESIGMALTVLDHGTRRW